MALILNYNKDLDKTSQKAVDLLFGIILSYSRELSRTLHKNGKF